MPLTVPLGLQYCAQLAGLHLIFAASAPLVRTIRPYNFVKLVDILEYSPRQQHS